jgi:hypothetical protein
MENIPKVKRLNIRITQEDYDFLKWEGINASALMRNAIDQRRNEKRKHGKKK